MPAPQRISLPPPPSPPGARLSANRATERRHPKTPPGCKVPCGFLVAVVKHVAGWGEAGEDPCLGGVTHRPTAFPGTPLPLRSDKLVSAHAATRAWIAHQ